MRNGIIIAILIGFSGVAPTWSFMFRGNDQVAEPSMFDQRTPEFADSERQTPNKAAIDAWNNTPELGEPLDVWKWRMSRGYYKSSSNESGAKHPYEYYEIETLEGLALNNDGLAQLVLGERLAFSPENQRRAKQLYWEAAINGYTASLSYMAADNMGLRLGTTGFDFPTKNEDGDISDDYADRLKFLAAAEYQGDFVASETLQAHLSSEGLTDSIPSRNRICQLGHELSNQIDDQRIKKFGRSRLPPPPIVSFEIPNRFCSS